MKACDCVNRFTRYFLDGENMMMLLCFKREESMPRPARVRWISKEAPQIEGEASKVDLALSDPHKEGQSIRRVSSCNNRLN